MALEVTSFPQSLFFNRFLMLHVRKMTNSRTRNIKILPLAIIYINYSTMELGKFPSLSLLGHILLGSSTSRTRKKWTKITLFSADMSKISQFKIGICQLKVTEDKNQNIADAREAIHSAAQQGARLVLLPEMWNCPYSNAHFSEFAEEIDDGDHGSESPTVSMLSEVASFLKITIVAGSIPERKDGLLYNTCCVFGPDGMLMAKHRKMHMFDIDMPGDISFRESDTFAAGKEPTVVDTDVGRIGIGICHDIRFPELAMLYRERGAHLICYPGAFNMSTGESLWELQQRARAADNQLYVATCSPSRDSTGSYVIWGHSTLVGPLGEIIETTGHEATILIGEIDYSSVQQIRKCLPLEKQRREDVYKLMDLTQEKA